MMPFHPLLSKHSHLCDSNILIIIFHLRVRNAWQCAVIVVTSSHCWYFYIQTRPRLLFATNFLELIIVFSPMFPMHTRQTRSAKWMCRFSPWHSLSISCGITKVINFFSSPIPFRLSRVSSASAPAPLIATESKMVKSFLRHHHTQKQSLVLLQRFQIQEHTVRSLHIRVLP